MISAPASGWPPRVTLPVTFRATFLGRPLQPNAAKTTHAMRRIAAPGFSRPIAESIGLWHEIKEFAIQRGGRRAWRTARRFPWRQNGRAASPRQGSIAGLGSRRPFASLLEIACWQLIGATHHLVVHARL